jgi:hypothetical protein
MWALNKISALSGWDISKGSGVIIAILDSGIDGGHQDLAANMLPGYNFVLNSSNTQPDGICHHGTPVAGTAASVGNNATGTIGIAWQSRILPVVIAGNTSSNPCWALWSTVASGITYAVDHGAKVVNISYGGTASSAALQSAENYAWSKGAIIVASAGNNGAGNNEVMYPASDPHVVSAAATDVYDAPASYSEYNQYIDLAAPGVAYTTDERGSAGYFNGWDYGNMSGTSFAAPTIAGLAALVWTVNPNLTNQQVIDLMQQNADDLGVVGYDIHYGWGRINLAKTLMAAKGIAVYTDTTAPQIQMSVPGSVSGQVVLSATASDNVGVTHVELYKDSVLYATAQTAPYTFYWDTTTETNGAHTVSVKAYDAAGNSASTPVYTTNVSNTPADTTSPVVSITAPSSGATVSGTLVKVSINATDNVAVSKTELYIDNVLISTAATYSWDTTKIINGSHTLTAKAYDAAGNVGTSGSVTVTVSNTTADTQSPTTTLSAPSNGATVSGSVSVSATASDNVGVSKVEWYKDGALRGTDTTAPYLWTWDTTLDADGAHVLQTKAYDAAGNIGASAQISVTVSNAVAMPPPPTSADLTPPNISIASPQNGATLKSNGTQSVAASASDASGISKITLAIDGTLVKTCLAATSCSYSWNMKSTTTGTHSITATATDNAVDHNTASVTASVTK